MAVRRSGNVMGRYRTALAWQVALAAYIQAMSWIPLGRWNYQPCCPSGLELLRRGSLAPGDAFATAAFMLPLALFWWGARTKHRWAAWLSLSAIAVWLTLQVWTWWPPYIAGASDRWAAVYARAFAQSTRLLPRWGSHLPPDGMHLVLQVLLAGTLAIGFKAVRRSGQLT